jgi:hypothetical protein
MRIECVGRKTKLHLEIQPLPGVGRGRKQGKAMQFKVRHTVPLSGTDVPDDRVAQVECLRTAEGLECVFHVTYTRYGSESAKDFADYAEKASTKSLGRALLALGYGTAFASEMDEGARVVDSPVVRREPMQRDRQPTVVRESPAMSAARPMPAAANGHEAGAPRPTASAGEEPPATEKQEASIRKLCEALGKPEPEGPLTYARARALRTRLSGDYQRVRRAS